MLIKNILKNIKTLKKKYLDLGDTLLHCKTKKQKLMSYQGAASNNIFRTPIFRVSWAYISV